MRERRRRHDDLHRPLGGRGKRATPPKFKNHDCVHPVTSWRDDLQIEQCVWCHRAVGARPPETNT